MLWVLLSVLLPCRCVGCGAMAGPVCRDCLAAARPSPRRRDPAPRPPGAPPVYAAAPYADVVRRAVLGFKERQLLAVQPFLAGLLAAAVMEAARGQPRLRGRSVLVLVPVPSSRGARRRRGFDHTRRLAKTTARRLTAAGQPAVVWPGLRHGRPVADQHSLDASARAHNVSGAFAARGSPPAGSVVVVDDVVTTGATVTEAARALRRAGVDVVAAAAVAATERRAGPSWGQLMTQRTGAVAQCYGERRPGKEPP